MTELRANESSASISCIQVEPHLLLLTCNQRRPERAIPKVCIQVVLTDRSKLFDVVKCTCSSCSQSGTQLETNQSYCFWCFRGCENRPENSHRWVQVHSPCPHWWRSSGYPLGDPDHHRRAVDASSPRQSAQPSPQMSGPLIEKDSFATSTSLTVSLTLNSLDRSSIQLDGHWSRNHGGLGWTGGCVWWLRSWQPEESPKWNHWLWSADEAGVTKTSKASSGVFLTWMTPPPIVAVLLWRNSPGSPSILPSQSITMVSSSVHAGLEACREIQRRLRSRSGGSPFILRCKRNALFPPSPPPLQPIWVI